MTLSSSFASLPFIFLFAISFQVIFHTSKITSRVFLGFPPHQSAGERNGSNRLRIAVCLAGHIRTFTNKTVRQSIQSHLLQPLQQIGAQVDVIFHVGLRDIPRTGTALSHRQINRRQLWKLFAEFSPVHISLFGNAESTCERPDCGLNQRVICPYALLRLEQCLIHIDKVERRKGKRYDWVYRSRPDIALGSNISTPLMLRSNVVYTNQHIPGASVYAHPFIRDTFPVHKSLVRSPIGDHIIVAHRQTAEIAFHAVKGALDCRLLRDMDQGTLNSEVILTYWLVKHGIAYDTLPWFWMLVREATGPECHRVEWIRRNGTRDLDIIERCLEFKRTGSISK